MLVFLFFFPRCFRVEALEVLVFVLFPRVFRVYIGFRYTSIPFPLVLEG